MQRIHPILSNSSTHTNHSVHSTTSHTHLLPSHDRIKSKRTTEEHHDLEAQAKEVTKLCNQYLKDNNHIGLALLARQKGIPPALRYKVWPVLLKYHPYVIAPYITATVENESDIGVDEIRIHKDLLKYFRIRSSDNGKGGNSPTITDFQISPIEEEIIRILQASIIKFFNKWGGIVKYDSGYSWMALNLAEWFPPIPNSHYVLIGKNHSNKYDPSNKHLTNILEDEPFFNLDDINSVTSSNDSNSVNASSSSNINNMSFPGVYERLVLVLLHSKEHDQSNEKDYKKNDNLITSSNKLNRREILFKSGKHEHHISMFLNILSKMLPELYKSLSDEQMLGNTKNNQWLTWCLKYCGTKVLNKFDRGRLWDSLLGFRLSYTDFSKEYKTNPKTLKIFKKFYSWDQNQQEFDREIENIDQSFDYFDTDPFWFKPSDDSNKLKWSQCDYQYQLTFIFISILHKNESDLLEFDQFEIVEFLNKLNYKKNSDELTTFDWLENDYIQKVINEAGDLWRTWVWNEIRDEIND